VSRKTKAKIKTLKSGYLIESALLMIAVVVPLSVQAVIFNNEDNTTPKEFFTTTDPRLESALDVAVLSAGQNPDPLSGRGGAEIVVNEDTLVSSGPIGPDVMANSKNLSGEISVYTVREGDTLSHIAEMYGVTANTILWANDLPKASSIKAGQNLVILPVAGVRHTIKKGDTIKAIAKTYDGDVDEILSYNQLSSDEALVVGTTLVIPGGAIHTAPVAKAYASPTKSSGSNSGSSWLSHPVPGSVKTQGLHGYNAVDLASSIGTGVRAAASGEVIVSKSTGWNGGYGQYIVVKHSNGVQTLYSHLSRNDVGVGDYVNQGEVIGGLGNTGKSTGPHLHFEVRGASNPF
jgi:murein DD-endopeptidase MepM/ murein hydrolase activator NlpD